MIKICQIKVYNVGIEHCPFNDHDLVSFKLKLDEIQRGPGIWIMNINTIKSEEFKKASTIWWETWKMKKVGSNKFNIGGM